MSATLTRVEIRDLRPLDRPEAARIFDEGIQTGDATFELGFGRQLLGALIESAERGGIWTRQSGIFPENVASIALHTSLGFRVVGVRERLGRAHDGWRDVLLLERRSEVTG